MIIRRGTKMFIFVLAVEIIFLLFTFLLSDNNCQYSTPCSVPTFFHPFGKLGGCVQMVTPPIQCNLGQIQVLEWSLIFTFIFYIIYLIMNRIRRNVP